MKLLFSTAFFERFDQTGNGMLTALQCRDNILGRRLEQANNISDKFVFRFEPTVMAKVGKLGKVLGPRGLMPNPKSGTVTLEVGKAVKEVKAGKIDFKIDKQGIIHVGIGKASFSADAIRDNAAEMIQTLAKLKPSSAKGAYFRSITLSTTMSPGISVDTNSIAGI